MEENYNEYEELDNYTERMLVGNQKLQQISEWIEHAETPEERQEYLKIFAAVYKEVAADARNADDAALRTSTLELENARLEEENRSNNAKELLDWVGKAALVGTTLFTGITQIWMFRRSTKKESDEAYLTTTDKTIVQESLTGRFWNKFGPKK